MGYVEGVRREDRICNITASLNLIYGSMEHMYSCSECMRMCVLGNLNLLISTVITAVAERGGGGGGGVYSPNFTGQNYYS